MTAESQPQNVVLKALHSYLIRCDGPDPEGELFRNRNGRPWTTEAVNCVFDRIQTRMGLITPDAARTLGNPGSLSRLAIGYFLKVTSTGRPRSPTAAEPVDPLLSGSLVKRESLDYIAFDVRFK